MPRIIVLTGSELRHEYFRKRLADQSDITVLRTYCEGLEKSHSALVERDENDKTMRRRHLEARTQSEIDFFHGYCELAQDRSNPRFIPKGDINDAAIVDEIVDQQPDLLVAYGCSLVRSSLLTEFEGRFLNVHLGLSPYYRGSGTNFWPLVEGEPELVGATFMHIDEGIDTGNIIHQLRARYVWGDTPSTVGNRLIRDMVPVYAEIIAKLAELDRPEPIRIATDDKVYKAKDFSEESVARLYERFRNGLVEDYLENETERKNCTPIICNPGVTTEP